MPAMGARQANPSPKTGGAATKKRKRHKEDMGSDPWGPARSRLRSTCASRASAQKPPSPLALSRARERVAEGRVRVGEGDFHPARVGNCP